MVEIDVTYDEDAGEVYISIWYDNGKLVFVNYADRPPVIKFNGHRLYGGEKQNG